MGYNTHFTGLLKFGRALKPIEFEYLNSILGEDTQNHSEWDEERIKITKETLYIDLRLSKCFTGIEWDDECEKTYDLPQAIKLVIALMHNRFITPGKKLFSLYGELIAKGEEFGDNWKIICDRTVVKTEKLQLIGGKIKCPHCEEYFILENK